MEAVRIGNPVADRDNDVANRIERQLAGQTVAQRVLVARSR